MDGARYERVQASFDDLLFSEQLVVWSLRAWVTAAKAQNEETRQELTRVIRQTMMASGIPAGYRQLSAILLQVTQTARREIDVRCGRCKQVSADERLFLAVLHGQQQSGQAEAGYLWLAEWVSDDAVAHVAIVCHAFAQTLLTAGLRLPEQTGLPATMGHDGPRSYLATVH